MKIRYFEGQVSRDIEQDNLPKHIASQEGTVWVDITDPKDSDIDVLQETFGFHPLAIEDIRNQNQRPKIEEFNDYLFIILKPATDTWQDGDLFRELAVFVGRNYLVTIHSDGGPLLDRVRLRLEPARLNFSASSTYLLYTLLDEIVDEYPPLLEQIEDDLDKLASHVFSNPDQSVLSRLFQLQQTLSYIGRLLGPQQDMINVLMNHQLLFIDQNSQYYLRDISDHLHRAVDIVRILRDTVNNLLNLYISTVSYRLNRYVNRLTLLAVIIGSMTVISGFYGMNFEHTWPPLAAWWSIPIVLLLMVVAVIAILASIRRQE